MKIDGYNVTEIYNSIKEEKYHIERKDKKVLVVDDKPLVFNSRKEANLFIKNYKNIKLPNTSFKYVSFGNKDGAFLITKKR